MNQTFGTFGTPGTLEPSLMPVALAETAVIALHGRLDQAAGIARGALETILAKAESAFAPLNNGELRRDAAFGRDLRAGPGSMALNRRSYQQTQLIVVHSTNSS
jgi:hypothetical protein